MRSRSESEKGSADDSVTPDVCHARERGLSRMSKVGQSACALMMYDHRMREGQGSFFDQDKVDRANQPGVATAPQREIPSCVRT